MRKLTFTALLVIFITLLFGQSHSFIHTSPINNSKFIYPHQIIVLKSDLPIINNDQIQTCITITGNVHGDYKFRYKLLDGNTILNLVAEKPFQFGEKIEVKVSQLRTTLGEIRETIKFEVMENDNLQMVRDYYQSQQREMELPIPKETHSGKTDLHWTPVDYPDPEIITHQESFSDGLYFFSLTPRGGGASEYETYLSINDEYGTPVFYRNTDHNTLNFTVLPDGKLTYAVNRYGDVELEKYYFLDSAYVVIDSVKTVGGYNMDGHDMLLLENGNYLLMSYDPQLVDMSTIIPGGNPNATVIGLVIQEVDLNGNLYFQWRSWDHFSITDATDDIDLTALSIDYVHGNAFEIDTDGNILISSRHLDEITKINKTTGDVMYRMGLLSKNNEFTFINDNLGFSHQHDVRLLPNGNITIYDNGNLHAAQFSRALEYEINESDKTATLVWFYRNEPDVFGMATGSYRRYSDGANLIGWGSTWPLGGSEVSQDKTIIREIMLPIGVYSYRILKNDWETNLFSSLKDIDFGNYYNEQEPKKHVYPVANNSGNPIRINSHHLHADEFFILDPLPIDIEPFDTVNVIIGFKPDEFGKHTDRFTINHDRNTFFSNERIARQSNFEGRWDPDKTTVSFNPEFGQTQISPKVEIVVTFSDSVRKFGGSSITTEDIEHFFIFKENNQWGADVGFTGTISEDLKVITIVPGILLKENTDYYIELKESRLQNANGDLINYPEITFFQTGMQVGMNDIHKSLDYNIYPIPASEYFIIDVEGSKNYKVRITNFFGQKMFEGEFKAKKAIINSVSYPDGIYIVSIYTSDGYSSSEKIVKIDK